MSAFYIHVQRREFCSISFTTVSLFNFCNKTREKWNDVSFIFVVMKHEPVSAIQN